MTVAGQRSEEVTWVNVPPQDADRTMPGSNETSGEAAKPAAAEQTLDPAHLLKLQKKQEKIRKKKELKLQRKLELLKVQAAEGEASGGPEAAPRRGRRNRIHPRNWGYTTHLDKVFGLKCFQELVCLQVFPDAKDISESYGALLAALRGLGAGRSSTQREVEQRRGVLAISIGDGTTARTATLVSFLTKWHSVSVDPILRDDWVIGCLFCMPLRSEPLSRFCT